MKERNKVRKGPVLFFTTHPRIIKFQTSLLLSSLHASCMLASQFWALQPTNMTTCKRHLYWPFLLMRCIVPTLSESLVFVRQNRPKSSYLQHVMSKTILTILSIHFIAAHPERIPPKLSLTKVIIIIIINP